MHSNCICTRTLTKKLMHLIGGTMSVVLDLPFSLCIWISAAVAIIYTLLGGLYSVAYTDVVQLFLIFCSLVMHRTFQSLLLKHTIKVLVIMATFVFCFWLQWICVPFVLTNPHTMDISQTLINNTLHAPWIGEMQPRSIGIITDDFLCFVRREHMCFLTLWLSVKSQRC